MADGRGALIERLLLDLFPLCRSLTGDAVRETLRILSSVAPIDVVETPTGTEVLDWTVPPEWNPMAATMQRPDGEVVVDFADHNLHLVSYSEPFTGEVELAALQPHLHSLADRPNAIPYRTTYWKRDWGLCLPEVVRSTLGPGRYRVSVATRLEPGSLSYGEVVVPGTSPSAGEFLISTHVCHPSMANDNLSGMIVAVLAAAAVAEHPRRMTHRFLFVPGTIGSICWLARNRGELHRIRHGLVLTGLGDDSGFVFKRSRRGGRAIDAIGQDVVGRRGGTSIDYYPYGYDERQYCSPGFDLPVARLSRRLHGTFPEYHTSDDDLSFVSAARILEALDVVLEIAEAAESLERPRNLMPYGEPQLGRRGLYRPLAGMIDQRSVEMAYLWLLAYADGEHDMDEISRRSGLDLADVERAADELAACGLLAR